MACEGWKGEHATIHFGFLDELGKSSASICNSTANDGIVDFFLFPPFPFLLLNCITTFGARGGVNNEWDAPRFERDARDKTLEDE